MDNSIKKWLRRYIMFLPKNNQVYQLKNGRHVQVTCISFHEIDQVFCVSYIDLDKPFDVPWCSLLGQWLSLQAGKQNPHEHCFEDLKKWYNVLAKCMPKAGQIYRHYKGMEFRVLDITCQDVNESMCVCYEPVDAEPGTVPWCIPLSDWNHKILLVNGEQVPCYSKV